MGVSDGIRRILASGSTVGLPRALTRAEIQGASLQRRDPRIAAALDDSSEFGLAEHLAGGPAALDRWRTGRFGANPVGAALVSAAVDFQRAGYFGPVPAQWLIDAHAGYLGPERNDETVTDLGDAFTWATNRTQGASSCLLEVEDGYYRPFDYLVDYTQTLASTELNTDESDDEQIPFRSLYNIPEEIWHTIGDNVSPSDPYYLSCVTTASLSLHPGLSFQMQGSMVDGTLSAEDLTDIRQMLALGKACLAQDLCVACQVLSMKLDLNSYVASMFGLIRPHVEQKTRASGDALDALVIVESLSSEGLDKPGTAMHEALKHIPAAHIRDLGRMLYSEGREESSSEWLKAAEASAKLPPARKVPEKPG